MLAQCALPAGLILSLGIIQCCSANHPGCFLRGLAIRRGDTAVLVARVAHAHLTKDLVQELQADTSTTSLHLFITIIKGRASNSRDLRPCLLWLLALGPLGGTCLKDTKCSFSGALQPRAEQPILVCFQSEFGHQLFWSLCVVNIIQLTAPTTIWSSQ